ncbi:TPA: F0F1 ATP synthase subunit A [Candidatus Saccharibacteria bacterium]|nr:F0F1 ATP synthase subunit A [Candidatus Saccharibacteria bacterium]HIO87272.1 F0F1 ATP synthase subunit A [Candidatus Saccharibacteria bacterium]
MILSTFFAAEDSAHISLKAEGVFTIGDFTVTNTMLYSPLVALAIVALGIYASKRIGLKPARGIAGFFELIVEYVINMLTIVFGNRKKAVKFAPVFGVYFIFIMLNNMSGLLPWVGSGLAFGPTPAFRPFTADLNSVLALSIFSICMVQYLSIKESGLKGHLQHYFTDKPANPINLFVGFLEVLGEVTRVISLSLRLFLNTVIGEILVSVFIFISGPATPFTLVPIILFELLVAYIQAYIFTVLSATYLAQAIHHDHEHETADSYEADNTSNVNPLPNQELRHAD